VGSCDLSGVYVGFGLFENLESSRQSTRLTAVQEYNTDRNTSTLRF